MKTEVYQKAIDKIRILVGESIKKQIPTLDYIMGVENMSESDKIWYETYKKYGNRNHTWQDFKAMFYGDIKTMQKNVKHWKSWDEINNLLSQTDNLRTQIIQLLKKYNLRSIDKNKTAEYEEYKKLYPDLITSYEKYTSVARIAQPNYSTFDSQIAKLQKEFEKKSKVIAPDDKKTKVGLVAEYIKKMDEHIDLKNADFVVGERIEIYRKIILNNPDILQKVYKFNELNGTEKVGLARMILNESSKIMGTPRGRVIQDDANDGPHVLTKEQGGGYNEPTKEFLFKGRDPMFSNLFSFLRVLAHEDAHRVDHYNAEYGMIGTQLMNFVEENYLNNNDIDTELYKKFATEQSSYYLDNVTGAALKYAIEHENV